MDYLLCTFEPTTCGGRKEVMRGRSLVDIPVMTPLERRHDTRRSQQEGKCRVLDSRPIEVQPYTHACRAGRYPRWAAGKAPLKTWKLVMGIY